MTEEAVTMEHLEAISKALRGYCDVIVTRLRALEVFTDALTGTLGKSLPPLLPIIQENMFSLADVIERDLPEDQRAQFRKHIASFDRTIEALK